MISGEGQVTVTRVSRDCAVPRITSSQRRIPKGVELQSRIFQPVRFVGLTDAGGCHRHPKIKT